MWLFSLKSTLKPGLLRCGQVIWEILAMGFIFFGKVVGCGSATLPKMYSLASVFQGGHSSLLLSIKISRYFRKVYFTEKPGCGC